MAHVTQEEVARAAGVNRATVSRALRDHRGVSEKERARIKAVAERMGHRPHPLLSALMKARRSRTPLKHMSLAFVTHYPTRDGWRREQSGRPDFFPGASARARDFGYKLEPFWLAEPGMTPRRFGDILAARGISGLLIGRLPPGRRAVELDWSRFSAVALGMTLHSPQLHHVTENHFDTVMQCMRQCIARGYKRVGFCFTDANASARVGDRWMAAFGHLQKTAFSARNRIPVCPGQPATELEFVAWFERHRPDALLVNDAPLASRWLRRIGVEVPRDAGLVELEDRDSGTSGIYYDPSEVGALAVDLLLGLLHRNQKGVPVHPHELLVSGEWRDRGTLPPRERA